MKVILKPMPVVFACSGCPQAAPAQQAAAALDRGGEAEASVMGRDLAKARARFPIHVVEGCDKRCATQWLASFGVIPQEIRVLEKSGSDPDCAGTG